MSDAGQAGARMPRYRSHKEVSALKIQAVEYSPTDPNQVILYFANARYAPRLTDRTVVSRYMPVTGDYLVVYDDGYQSISPGKAFEEGYTLIGGQP